MPFTNRLINATSPYLLQHAHNPVDWYPWGEEALTKARQEDKPILVSIGYSACHWCHVMERECFENEDIAQIMNRYFVCIKVDREERPEIDQIYMEALHAMGLNGGWPLNVFLTPEAKPFYGGTYFPPRQWKHLLQQIAKAFAEHRDQINQSAEQFNQVLNRNEEQYYGLSPAGQGEISMAEAEKIFSQLSTHFDRRYGGMNRAPKFPMPAVYLFLLRYWRATGHQLALEQVELTLTKMARGGIYDQIGGGFARYSVDAKWFVPHFEKMLYDNAQLISLYAEAYLATRRALYRHTVEETIDFVCRELLSPEGGFYCALDADSQGIEGRFYTWKNQELEEALQEASLPEEEIQLCKQYYGCTLQGNWEHGYNILHRPASDKEFARNYQLSLEELQEKICQWKAILLNARASRVRPGLDDKILTGWNGLMIKALVDAYAALGKESYLKQALQTAQLIEAKMTLGSQLLRTYKNGKADLVGCLEDYAAVIQGYLALYQVSGQEKWLSRAVELTYYVFDHFSDSQGELFYFVDSQQAAGLIARKKEIFDNVIPSSNSIMAQNLFTLSLLLPEQILWKQKAEQMLLSAIPLLKKEVYFMANWATLFLQFLIPPVEIAITGPQAERYACQLQRRVYAPHKVIAFSETPSQLTLLQHRFQQDKTRIFICQQYTCQQPVETVEAAIEQMQTLKIC